MVGMCLAPTLERVFGLPLKSIDGNLIKIPYEMNM